MVAACLAAGSGVAGAQTDPGNVSFSSADGRKIDAINFGSYYAVPSGDGAVLMIDRLGKPGDIYTGRIATTTCSAPLPCRVTLPPSTSIIEKYPLIRTSSDGTQSSVAVVDVVSFAGLPIASNGSDWTVALPGGYGSLKIGVTSQADVPVLKLSTVASSNTPFSLAGDGTITLDGTQSSGTFTGSVIVEDRPIDLNFTVSAGAMTGSMATAALPSIPIGTSKASVKLLTLTGAAKALNVVANVTLTGVPLLGDITGTNLTFSARNGVLRAEPKTAQWASSAGPGKITFGQIELGYTAINADIDSASRALKLTIVAPTVASFTVPGAGSPQPHGTACGAVSTIAGGLTFIGPQLLGDKGLGTPLTLAPITVPFRDTCLRATDAKVTISDAPRTFALAFNGEITGDWLGKGTFKASGLNAQWTDPSGFTMANGATFTYSGDLKIDTMPVTDLRAALATDGTLSGGFSIGTAAFRGAFKDRAFSGTFENVAFKFLDFDYQDIKGGFTLSDGAAGRELYIDTATLAVTQLRSAASVPLKLIVTPSGAGHALKVAYENSAWRAHADANIERQGDASFAVGPLGLALEPVSEPKDLRPEFRKCVSQVASFTENAGLILCGKLQVREPAVNGVLTEFCTRVGVRYKSGTSLEFATLRTAPTNPAVVIDPDCANSFSFANMFSAQLQAFRIAWDTTDPTKPGTFLLDGQVLVKPTAGIPGINTALFESALFRFNYLIDDKHNQLGFTGMISSLQPFSIPNVVNFRISQLEVTASHDFLKKVGDHNGDTVVVLNAGDSAATLAGPLGITVYGRGGGLEFHTATGEWKTHFPGIKLPATILSFIGQVISTGAAYNFARNGLRLH